MQNWSPDASKLKMRGLGGGPARVEIGSPIGVFSVSDSSDTLAFAPSASLSAAVRSNSTGEVFVDSLRSGRVEVDGLGVFVLREKPGSTDGPLAVSFYPN